MKLTLTFWKHTVGWAVGLSVMFTFLSFLGGGGAAAVGHIPAWLGLGLALGTYPAGVRLAAQVLPDDHRDLQAVGVVTANAVGASLLFLMLAGYLGPVVLKSREQPAAGDVTEVARTLTLTELRSEMRARASEVDPTGSLEPTTMEAWFPVNVLAWQFFVRLSGAVLPFLFTWIGVMAGFWGRAVPRVEGRATSILAIGFLLLFSTYLANENSFEWIVVQAAGPVPFAGLFALLVPSLLGLGMAWPTMITQLKLPAQ